MSNRDEQGREQTGAEWPGFEVHAPWGPTPPPPPGSILRPSAVRFEPSGRRHRRRGTAGIATVTALFLLASGVGIGWRLTRAGETGGTTASGPGAVQAPSTTIPSPATLPESPIRAVPASPPVSSSGSIGMNPQSAADQLGGAIVDINTTLGSPFGTSGAAAGTGMVLTPTGEILTNNHVIAGATRIEVTIPGRSGSWRATVIGANPDADVALIQIRGVSGLRTVQLADSSAAEIGQEVLAIGNALGQGGAPTVTKGAISAVGRSISVSDERGGVEHLGDLIQMDAPISPGDSGGAVVNTSGQVVGMITASARTSFDQTTSHVGFAITSNAALDVVNQIRSGHETTSVIIGRPGFLGVQVRNLDSATASKLGLSVSSGALVLGVVPNAPADSAGIAQYAAITAVNGQHVGSADALGPALWHHDPGQRVRVTWTDANGTHTSTIRLVAGPAV